MKLTYLALLAGTLAFTGCERGADDDFGREVNDPRIETTNRDNFSGSQQSGAVNSGTTSPGAANTGGANTLPRDTTTQPLPTNDGTVDNRPNN